MNYINRRTSERRAGRSDFNALIIVPILVGALLAAAVTADAVYLELDSYFLKPHSQATVLLRNQYFIRSDGFESEVFHRGLEPDECRALTSLMSCGDKRSCNSRLPFGSDSSNFLSSSTIGGK